MYIVFYISYLSKIILLLIITKSFDPLVIGDSSPRHSACPLDSF